MPRLVQHLLDGSLLDEPARVEDADLLAHLRDHPEVVADEQHRGVELGLQAGDEVEHLRFDGRVESGRRLVEDQQRRVLRERHRDHDALLHPAGQLMRIAVHDGARIGDLHLRERTEREIRRFVVLDAAYREHFGDLLPHADRRVERRAGILVHHRHVVRTQFAQLGTRQRDDVASRNPDLARPNAPVARQIADDRERSRRLAAARLADEPVRMPALDRQRHAAQHLPLDAAYPIGDVDVDELERRLECGSGAHRSSTCVSPSATRLTPTTSDATASPGKSTVHQYDPPASSE